MCDLVLTSAALGSRAAVIGAPGTKEPLELPDSHTWAPQGAGLIGMSHLDDRRSRAFLAGRTLANR